MGSVPEPAANDPSSSAPDSSDTPDAQVAALQLDNSPVFPLPEEPPHDENLPVNDPQQENSPTGENLQEPTENRTEEEAEGEEEEEGECGFCLFMKSGPCRDTFINWEGCVEEAEKAKEDIVAKCHQVTLQLKECMESHPDYYEPVLQAEKEMSDAALEGDEAELQEENAKNQVPSDHSEAREEGSLSMQQTATQNSEEPSQSSQ